MSFLTNKVKAISFPLFLSLYKCVTNHINNMAIISKAWACLKNVKFKKSMNCIKRGGGKIGVNFRVSGDVVIDQLWPFLLDIGDDVHLTNGVTILNHDFSWSVIKKRYGVLSGGVGPVKIGNNVFIGNHAIILKDTVIGDNTIVGAGSVVSGVFPSDVVIAGVPAKIVCSLQEFKEKRVAKQYKEAAELVRNYRKAFNNNPSKERIGSYFWLWEPREKSIVESNGAYLSRMMKKGNYEDSISVFMNSAPMFPSYEDFIASIK